MNLLTGFVGGCLIGLAAAVLLLLSGDILGSSGIISSILIQPKRTLTDPGQHWKLVTTAAFLLLSWAALAPNVDVVRVNSVGRSTTAYLLAGLFVGFGTRLGNGCTSGHGICGMARLSIRSISAVITFMMTAFVTTGLTNNLSAFDFLTTNDINKLQDSETYDITATVITFTAVALAIVAPFFYSSFERKEKGKLIGSVVAGGLFSSGLYIGQMIYPTKVLDFLDLSLIVNGGWDPSLAMVMGGGCIVSFVSYQFVEGHRLFKKWKTIEKPLACGPDGQFCVPSNTQIDDHLILGAIFFGLGWGICGLCPAPALLMLSVGVPNVTIYWWPMYIVGAFLAHCLKQAREKKQKAAEATTTAEQQPEQYAAPSETSVLKEVASSKAMTVQEDQSTMSMNNV